jgi:HK97 family phage major capsid protein
MAVNITTRADTMGDLPPSVASRIITGATGQSAALQLFTQIPMARRQDRIRVEAALPTAYWVTGDTGMKTPSAAAWTDRLMTAEEIAVILPIPENVIADASYDLWGAITPRAEEAIGRALDAAIFFGVNKPASYPVDIVAGAVAAGNVVNRGDASAAEGGIVGDFNNLYGTVEDEGFDVNGVVANRRLRRFVRGARTTYGERYSEIGAGGNDLDGTTLVYSMRGQWPSAAGADDPIAIAGDFTQGIVGIRQDITAKMLTEAVIQDPTDGSILYNLAQQDMVALRLTARFGFVVSNYFTREQPNADDRYPFGVLTAGT